MAQRERAIRFWLGLNTGAEIPDSTLLETLFTVTFDTLGTEYRETAKSNFNAIARGGLSTEYLFLTCHADFTVTEYLLGSGPAIVTVAYDRLGETRSYDLYRREHETGQFGADALLSQEDYEASLSEVVEDAEQTLASRIGGYDSVVFLAPMGAHNAIAVEVWQAVAQWDIQTEADGTVNAVRYGAPEGYPEHTQTLNNLRSRITAGAASDGQAGNRIANISGLNQYYRDIGAYDDITPDDGSTATFTPAQPPPVYAPAPATLTATASGEDAVNLSWSSVSGASGYHVQHRLSGDDHWATADSGVTGTTYAASGLPCNMTHAFRVGAYGDGSTYNVRAGLWSSPETATTDTCSPQPPRFEEDPYSFDISVIGEVGDIVGAVSAIDVNGDRVTYTIESGDEAGKFAIDGSTGEIALAAVLGSPVGTSFTLTVGASDGVSGTSTVTVAITVVAITCTGGAVVPNPGSEPALVRDCETLLGFRDVLAGTGALNWDLDTGIANWDGVALAGTPLRVTELDLSSRSLTGVVPGGLGELTGLERLKLNHNFLSGGIPKELGGLVELEHFQLSNNMLSGPIPSELGNLSKLKELFILSNDLSGEIPSELGDLPELEQLLLSGNDLSGPIPAELGGLSKLRELWLYENRLSGTIPPELGGLTSVRVLSLNDNELSGSIPWELGELPSLLRLALSDNRFEGCLRPSLRNIASHDLEDLRLPDCIQDGRVPAPGGLAVTLLSGTFTITWSAVTGAAEYEAQHHVQGSQDDWESLTATSGTTSNYSPAGGPECGTTYQFRVRAYGDGVTYVAGWGPQSGEETVTTEPCNQAPQFDKASYEYSVAEDAAVDDPVGNVSATDPDAGDTVSYSITQGNDGGKFAIGDETGDITVVAGLDYETASSYTLTVEASDGRGGVDTVEVDIEVTDVAEDLPPAPGGLAVTLLSGTFTITWSAVTGAAEYEAQHHVQGSQDDWESLTATSGTTSNYSPAGGPECGTTYQFRVRAYGDGVTYVAGWGPQSGEETVTTEPCNQAPQFDKASYEYSVAEDAAVDDPVGNVSATDPDAGDTVSYSITQGNDGGKFAIGDETGDITVVAGLDYETASSYTLTVEASDGRGGVDTVEVDIEVTDVAEDLPPAPGGLAVTLLSGTFTITWSAVTGAAEYEAQHHVQGSQDDWESLTATSGTTSNYSPAGGPECGTTYQFRVRAYGDGVTYVAGWGPQSGEETVTTEPCNQAPQFDKASYEYSVAEDAAVDDPVGNVSATDPDAGDTVSYSITQGNDGGKFAIGDETGDITVVAGLDYETASSYTLTVEASDGRGGVDTVEVDIEVTDVAEDLPPAPGGLAVTLLSGTFTITWSAVTGAAEYEAQHHVQGSQDDWESLTATSGTSSNYTPAGGPECGTTYQFRVRAYGDGVTYVAGWGPQSGEETVTTEMCDRAPVFAQPTYSLTVAEDAATNSPVGNVSATDPDPGDTATHSITHGNHDEMFMIDGRTGEIAVAGALDPDEVAFYALTVEAMDANGNTATASVGIAVILTECSNGTVVSRPALNPGLVRDCSMLLAARDDLAGEATLDWSATTHIDEWQGVRVEPLPSPHVRALLLTDAGLTGSVPAALGGLADIRRIDLDENVLTGQIPSELGSLPDLERVYIQNNQLTGQIPVELGRLKSLKTLYLSGNSLTGGIPVELGRLRRLTQLVLDGNSLEGEIPTQLGDLSRLEHLYLRDNGFTGTIPSELEGLSNLTYLYLDGNSFTGCIPAGLRDIDNNDLDTLGLLYCGSSSQ